MAITNKTILRIGSKEKDNIKTLQMRLKALAYYTGKVDGSFGPVTKAAVIAYQKSKKLVRDGVAGPITLRSLGLLHATPTPTKTKTTVSTITKGTIQTAIETKLGSFTNFTGFYNKMIGRGYNHYFNDKKSLTQELNDLANLNCVDASQLAQKLGTEMGYTMQLKHVVCPKSGEGHIVIWGKGKELGTAWVWIDLAAAMSVGSKYPIGKAWCQDSTEVTNYTDAVDDGKA